MTKRLPTPRLLTVLLAAALCGCAAGPAVKLPELQAPADWSSWHGGAQELARGPRDSATPGDAWWRSFQDNTLTWLLDESIRANPDLQSAALRFTQSRAQRLTVAAQRFPEVNGNAGVTRKKVSENGADTRQINVLEPASQAGPLSKMVAAPYTDYQAGFDASWELDLWGRVRHSQEGGNADVAAAAAALAEMKLTMEAEVARRYFELRTVQQRLRIAHNQIATCEQALRLTQAQADYGLVDELAVTRQEGLLADSLSGLSQWQAQEAQAMNQITLLLNLHPGSLNRRLADNGSTLKPDSLPDLRLGVPSELAHHRPDILTAEAKVQSAIASIGVAKADLYPRITLGATFGLESTSSRTLGDWSSNHWTIGPSLSVPIFDRGRRRAVVKLRELQQQEAAVIYQETVLKAWHEVDDDLSAYAAERQHNLQLAEKTRITMRAFQLAQVRHRSGLTSELTELDARRDSLQAEQQQAESDGQIFVKMVVIYKALGDSTPVP